MAETCGAGQGIGQAKIYTQVRVKPHAERLHEFMAQRGILLRLFVHDSSVRLGLPDTEADWLRLDEALAAYKEAT